jgi:hypothetical protein
MRRALRLGGETLLRGVLRLIASCFELKCGRILGRDRCWLGLSTSLHFPTCSTVELFSLSLKLILTILLPEPGSYRGALHFHFVFNFCQELFAFISISIRRCLKSFQQSFNILMIFLQKGDCIRP